MNFTERELYLLSEGLLALIENGNKAGKLTTDDNVHTAIDGYLKEVQALNSKVCAQMKD